MIIITCLCTVMMSVGGGEWEWGGWEWGLLGTLALSARISNRSCSNSNLHSYMYAEVYYKSGSHVHVMPLTY